MKPAAPHAPLTLAIGPTEIVFTWSGDRWTHHVATRDAGTWQSVEGPRPEDGDQRWPASPVLVELSTLQTAAGPAILGVGLAGRSHFSASIGPDPEQPDRIRFEIACRFNEPPVWLGTTSRGPAKTVFVRPRIESPAAPATVQWGYSFGPAGLAAADGFATSEPAAPGRH